ncbi:hypothetical protein BD626DRAFT_550870 [Schizophyllum amplum]|uniref:Uncharacterized protein n=1 Tax=Schizophyllum amplum TaxID=97359 RepID=A0A550BZA2_9AGAR|nr:hypothetical protein BD626DRAFT_550870 [Auriculariopsis ampla]
MSDLPALHDLTAAAREIRHNANAWHSEITPLSVRREIEKQFGLEEKAIDNSEYKSPVMKAVKEAVREDKPEVEPALTLTAKAASKPRSQTTKGRGKKRKSEEAALSDDDADEEVQKPRSKAVRKQSSKQFKSRETIDDSSDIEPAPPSSRTAVANGDMKENQTAKSTKKRKSTAGTEAKPSKTAKTEHSEEPEEQASKDDDKSDSEMSVLIDEPPKRARKSSTKEKGKGATKASKPRKSAGELSKDEETIKRLKSFVVACGVRKVWSKVFKDADKPSDQIRILRKMLADLGMSGRLSMEQARAIKEQRELAQELEDVQQFAAKVAGRSSRSAAKKAKEAEADSDDEKIVSDEEAAPRRNAHRSIMAFLADQSDSE